jgi:CDP-diglyceride synthetase
MYGQFVDIKPFEQRSSQVNKEMIRRTLSGVSLLIVFIPGLFWGIDSFVYWGILIAVIWVKCFSEFMGLYNRAIYVGGATYGSMFRSRDAEARVKYFRPWLYIWALFLPAAIMIRGLGNGYAVMFVAIVWTTDTMAFAVGKMFGKHGHKLAPRLSPKKTWEGSIGGGVAAILMAALSARIFGLSANLFLAAAIGAIVSITVQLGDLAESGLKRLADVKDSGQFFPGHGGFLDRFDGFIPAAIVALPLLFLLK